MNYLPLSPFAKAGNGAHVFPAEGGRGGKGELHSALSQKKGRKGPFIASWLSSLPVLPFSKAAWHEQQKKVTRTNSIVQLLGNISIVDLVPPVAIGEFATRKRDPLRPSLPLQESLPISPPPSCIVAL